MTSTYKIIEEVCVAVGNKQLSKARETIRSKYPFNPLENTGRKYSEYQKARIFLRDGFIDRYSGEKLVFPPVLRLLSVLMPEEFPFHKNWKMSECHLAYWQLFPTIDHVIPVSRGGADDESNWVCTSQLRNSAKSNWLLEELGWELHKSGGLSEWDGLTTWFLTYAADTPEILKDSYMYSWHKVLKRMLDL